MKCLYKGKVGRLLLRCSKAIFREDVVIVYFHSQASQNPFVGEVKLTRGGIDQLKSLSLLSDYKDVFAIKNIKIAIEREKMGDYVYLAWFRGKCVHIAWAGSRAVISADEVGHKAAIKLNNPGLLVYDCWTPPKYRGQGIYPNVLRQIILDRPGKDGVWIYSRDNNQASTIGILKAGFVPTYRMERRRVLLVWERARVTRKGM